VVRHADVVEPREYIFADAIVDNALALDRALLLGIEGGRIVLEILDQRARLGAFIKDLGLAFVDLAAAGHRIFLGTAWLEKQAPAGASRCRDCTAGASRPIYAIGA
jgi:hypothetical protein